MESTILEYLVSVPGAEENGHPIQRIEGHFQAAAKSADQLRERFPEHDVFIHVLRKIELHRIRGIKPKPPEPKCPRGCEGTRDGRPVVIRTEKGLVQCSICGYLGA